MSDEIKEYPVADWPGWTRLEIKSDGGSTRQYRHDNTGKKISNRQFMKLKEEFKGGYVPEEYIRVIAGNALPQFASSRRVGNPPVGVVDSTATPVDDYDDEEPVQTTEQPQFSYAPPPPRQKILAGTKRTPGITKGMASRAAGGPHLNQQRPTQSPNPPPEKESVNILENVTPKSHPSKPGRKIENGATAKELADGLYITLSIVTSLVAMLTKTPGLTIADIEAKNIAIPAGNLLEPTDLNKHYGRMIAESGDWQLLGYACWLYVSRVTDVVKEKQNTGGGNQNIPPPRQHTPQQNGAYNPQYQAALPYVQRSTPIVRPGGAL